MDLQGEGVVVAFGEGEGRGIVAGGAAWWKTGAVAVAIDAAEGAVHGHQETFSN